MILISSIVNWVPRMVDPGFNLWSGIHRFVTLALTVTVGNFVMVTSSLIRISLRTSVNALEAIRQHVVKTMQRLLKLRG